MMTPLISLIELLETIFPSSLAEDWDNVGLLLGDRKKVVHKVMTCLTIDSKCIEEAIREKADLIVSHHPFPFRSDRKWTSDTVTGRHLMALLSAGIAVYSPHTAHDSAAYGINEQLANNLGVNHLELLFPAKLTATEQMYSGLKDKDIPATMTKDLGTGRIGCLEHACPLREFVQRVGIVLNQPVVSYAGDDCRLVHRVAFGCGAADDFIDQAVLKNADTFVTGEARFHRYLDAVEQGIALVTPGHFATERFAMQTVADRLRNIFPNLDVWLARDEKDPVKFHSSVT